MRKWFYLAALASIIILSGTSWAVQSDATFGDRIDVELVLVDVLVEDTDGNPILDLEATDFEILEDRQVVEIRHFTPPAEGSDSNTYGGQTRSGGPDAASTPRRVVLFVDSLHLHPRSRHRVFDHLSRSLEGLLEPTDEVMVVDYAGTARVALEMTSNRKALKNALRDMANPSATSLLAPNDDRSVIDLIGNLADRYTIAPAGAVDSHCREVGFIAHSHAQQTYNRVQGSIGELNQFVNSLAGYEGPKVLLHISDGIPLVPGTEAYRFASELCDGTGGNKGLRSTTDTTQTDLIRYNNWDPTQTSATLREFDTSKDWSRLASHANSNQVSFYTFQAQQQGLRASGVGDTRTSFDTESEAERNRQDPLLLLARETGGVATLGSNDVEPALRRMNDDARFSYQLAFEPSSPGDGRLHHIRVKVDRAKVKLRHRQNYFSKSTEESINDRVLSALLYGRSANPLDVDLKLREPKAEVEGVHKVDVEVRVPVTELVMLPDGETQRGLFTVYLAVRNGYGQLTPVGHKRIPLALPLGQPKEDFVYTVSVPVRGDQGTVAVAVHDELGAEVSYLRREVTLPNS